MNVNDDPFLRPAAQLSLLPESAAAAKELQAAPAEQQAQVWQVAQQIASEKPRPHGKAGMYHRPGKVTANDLREAKKQFNPCEDAGSASLDDAVRFETLLSSFSNQDVGPDMRVKRISRSKQAGHLLITVHLFTSLFTLYLTPEQLAACGLRADEDTEDTAA